MSDIHGILILKPVFSAQTEILPGIWAGKNLYNQWAVLPSDAEPDRDNALVLQSGDAITIFKTAAEGPVLWEGDIKLVEKQISPKTGKRERAAEYGAHYIQDGLPGDDWAGMFAAHRPAQLTKKGKNGEPGKIVFGSAFPFAETGSEGTWWCLQDWENKSYDGLHNIDNGDRLKIFDHVTKGETVFDGKLTLMPKFHEAAYADHYKEKFQLRPMEILPNDLMTYCVWNLPVTVSRPS